MGREGDETKIREQILRSLRDFYPIKADESVVVSSVKKAMTDVSSDRISQSIRFLRDDGLIEESVVKAPFGRTEAFRFKMTSSGIKQLQVMETGGMDDLFTNQSEIQSRLGETHELIKSGMRRNKEEMERFKEEINKKIQGLSSELAEVMELVNNLISEVGDEKSREEQGILRVLTGDERTIYDIILNAGGQMVQKDLITRARI